MSLRIISGYLKGRRIEVSKDLSYRPTSDMLREALFNICQFQIEGTCFLDLFSGTGALGIEAISRGASFCLFVEQSRLAAHLIQKNLKNLQIEEKGKVVTSDVLSFLKKISSRFDIVTLDPPYDFSKEHPEKIEEIFQFLKEYALLKEGAQVFFEEGFSKNSFEKPPSFSSFLHKNSRKFGKSVLHHYLFQGSPS
jgi:16S rRNA (guanine966-N2)-methyltransferase